jgi:hypothetical protein
MTDAPERAAASPLSIGPAALATGGWLVVADLAAGAATGRGAGALGPRLALLGAFATLALALLLLGHAAFRGRAARPAPPPAVGLGVGLALPMLGALLGAGAGVYLALVAVAALATGSSLLAVVAGHPGLRGAPVGAVGTVLTLAALMGWLTAAPATRATLDLASPGGAALLALDRDAQSDALIAEALQKTPLGAGDGKPDPVHSQVVPGAQQEFVLITVAEAGPDAPLPGDGWVRLESAYSAWADADRALDAILTGMSAADAPDVAGLTLPARLYDAGRATLGGGPAGPVDGMEIPLPPGDIDAAAGALEARLKHRAEADLQDPTADVRPTFLWLHVDGADDLARAFERLSGVLEAGGRLEHTVFAAVGVVGGSPRGIGQHRVGLDDGRMRVLFAMRGPELIPGKRAELASTEDVVPTLLHLTYSSYDPALPGFTLGDALRKADAPWPRTAALLAASNGLRALVEVGADGARAKTLYDPRSGSLHRFDLAADPDERVTAFDPTTGVHRASVLRLVQADPNLVDPVLERDPALSGDLGARLAKLDPIAEPVSVRLLFHAAAERLPAETVRTHADRIYLASRQVKPRIAVIRAVARRDEAAAGEIVQDRLTRVAGTSHELFFINALSNWSLGPLGRDWVAHRFDAWLREGRPHTWLPYLRLVQRWGRKPPRWFSAALEGGLAAREEVGDYALIRLLELFAEVDFAAAEEAWDRRPIHRKVLLEVLDGPRTALHAGAARALGYVGDSETRSALQARLGKADDATVKAALEEAIARLGQDGAG